MIQKKDKIFDKCFLNVILNNLVDNFNWRHTSALHISFAIFSEGDTAFSGFVFSDKIGPCL